MVPSALNTKDIISLTSHFEKKIKSTAESICMADTYLVSKTFLKTLQTKFQTKMEDKAVEDLKKKNCVLAIRTEHAFVGGFSSGSTSTNSNSAPAKGSKSVRGKKEKAAVETHDESMIEIVFIDKSGLTQELKDAVKDEINDDILDSLIEHFLRYKFNNFSQYCSCSINSIFLLSRPLNVQYFELLKSKVESGLINVLANETDKDTANKPIVAKKLTIKDLQEKIKLFLINARIFEKSIKLFTGWKLFKIRICQLY